MTAPAEITVPDIGDFSGVPVAEVQVSVGDRVDAEDTLVTLESDEATMDVPAPSAGSVTELLVGVGDAVSRGTPILRLSSGDGAAAAPSDPAERPSETASAPAVARAPAAASAPAAPNTEPDAYRKQLDAAARADRAPYRVTLLAFLVKASLAALQRFPEFNSSLSAERGALVVKRCYNIGIAVDTPGGLVVPVVRGISPSYDHRVIDGALAARFARHLCQLLEDDRRLLL